MKTIGIFPASGKLGGSTYRHLLELVPYDRVVLICRHPDKVPAHYTQGGVRVRQASYEDTPAELEAAFAGIDVLFLISFPSFVESYRVRVQVPAVDAARRAGVQHLVYSSLAYGGGPDGHASRAEVMRAHLVTEAHLRAAVTDAAAAPSSTDHNKTNTTPFRFTSLREGLYAESVPIYTAFFNPEQDPSGRREICIPHDGSGPGVAWVKIDDLGEASARIVAAAAFEPTAATPTPPPALAGAARQLATGGDTLLLSGTRAWTLAETVDAVFNSQPRKEGEPPVRIRPVSVDEYARLPAVQAVYGAQAGNGRDTRSAYELATGWATAWEAIREGEVAVVTPTLREVLGREPTPPF